MANKMCLRPQRSLWRSPEDYEGELKTAIAAHVFNSLDAPCADQRVCLSRTDEAFAWLAAEIGLEATLAKNLGPEEAGRFYLTDKEGKAAREEIKREFKKTLKKQLEVFATNEKICRHDQGAGALLRPLKRAKLIKAQAYTMLHLVDSEKESGELIKENKTQALKKIRGDFGWNDESKKRKPASEEEKGKRAVCGGEEFHPSVENKEIFGFHDPRSGRNNQKQAWDIYKKHGMKGLKAMNTKKAIKFKGRGGKTRYAASKFSPQKFLKKLSIPSPIVRCTPESPLLLPRVGLLEADKKVCCNEKVETRKMNYAFSIGAAGSPVEFSLDFPIWRRSVAKSALAQIS